MLPPAGMYTGSIFGLALSPHMVEVLHWPSVFYIFGFVGIFWYIAWQRLAASCPSDDTRITAAERDYIVDQTVSRVSEALGTAAGAAGLAQRYLKGQYPCNLPHHCSWVLQGMPCIASPELSLALHVWLMSCQTSQSSRSRCQAWLQSPHTTR